MAAGKEVSGRYKVDMDVSINNFTQAQHITVITEEYAKHHRADAKPAIKISASIILPSYA
jgi:hypothetical protein